MMRRVLRGRDYGGAIVFLAVLAILFYVSNGLLSVVTTIRLPVISARANSQRADLIDSLAEPTATAVPGATATAEAAAPTSTPPPAPTAVVRKVGNTGGLGVYLRRTPTLSDRIRAWADNSEMTLLGEAVEVNGFHWLKVRDPAGNEGWIPQQFLAGP